MYKKIVGVLICMLLIISGFTSAMNIKNSKSNTSQDNIKNSNSDLAQQLAEAIIASECHDYLVSAEFLAKDSSEGIVLTSLGMMIPQNGDTFALLSTGIAGANPVTTNAEDPGNEYGTDFEGGSDYALLILKIDVPSFYHYLYFDFQYLSTDYPEKINGYIDEFMVLIDSPSKGVSTYTCDVNSGNFVLDSSYIPGTGFDIFSIGNDLLDRNSIVTTTSGSESDAGGTALVTRGGDSFPISPNEEIEIQFYISDKGDDFCDSAVYIDNLIFSGYQQNSPPFIPEKPSGPTSGQIIIPYTFCTVSSDTFDNDERRYGWDWNDDDIVDEWSDYYLPGEECCITHEWLTLGTKQIKVIAEDEYGLQSSGFSESLSINIIANYPPDKPDWPYGPTNGLIDTSYTYSTSTTDPEGDEVYYLFEWGDGSTSDWLGPYNSGDPCQTTHTWSEAGGYIIYIKAKDTNDDESDWSNGRRVFISGGHPMVWDDYYWNRIYDAGSKIGYTFPFEEDPNILINDFIVTKSTAGYGLHKINDCYWGSEPFEGAFFVEITPVNDCKVVTGITDDIKDILTEEDGNLWEGTYKEVDISIDWDDDLSVTWGVKGLETTISSDGTTKSAFGWKDIFYFEIEGTMVTAMAKAICGIEENPAYHQTYKFEVGGWTILDIEIEGTMDNSPPNTPSKPNGPITGIYGAWYDYSTSATDPDGNNIRYRWDMDGNGIPDKSTSYYSSGETASIPLQWRTSGTYNVKVKAVDKFGDQSGWSEPLKVTITEEGDNLPPNKPDRPSGTTSGKAGNSYPYTASTTDPDGDQISYKFNWGDGTDSGWLPPIPSGQIASSSHAWSSQGSFSVKVQAKDSNDAESEWSDPLSVSMPKNKAVNTMPLFLRFLQQHQMLYQLFQRFLQLNPFLFFCKILLTGEKNK